MPEEVRFFGRLGAWGVLVGTGYGVLTQEVVGTVALVAFGIGAGFLAVVFGANVRRTGRGMTGEGPLRWVGLPSRERDESPFGDETARIPSRSLAPLEMGLGIALASLGLVFGPWLYLAAALPIVAGVRDWVRGAVEEYRAVERTRERGP